MRPAHRRARGRRAPHGLEAVGVLAGTDPARTLDGRIGPPDVTAARVEAARLGRGRRRLRLVVHRIARCVRRRRAALRRAPATTSSNSSGRGCTSRWSSCWNDRSGCPCPTRCCVRSLTDRTVGQSSGLVVVVEGDAVLLRERGVLVILGLHWHRAVTEPEVERPGAGLLQFSRLFETAMTTLLHDRAPTLES